MQSPVKIWRNQQNVARLFGKTGQIVSWTMIRVPPGGFAEQAPYPVALVRMEGGQTITAQVVDTELHEVRIGARVRTVIRRVRQPDADGVIPYGIKVKPV